jgi:pimeloyl-ACP methyl ester carboxylesterase
VSVPGALDHAGRRLLHTLFGYDSEWVDTSVGRLHVLSRAGGGTLPPVVLFHGFGSAALHWVPLLHRLRPHVRGVMAIDLPGHGFSDRPTPLTHDVLRTGVIEALDQVHRHPAVVVGNSLGGVTALRYTHARPDKVLGTVLLSPGGAPMTAEELDALRAIFRIRSRGEARAFLDRLYAKPIGLLGHLFVPTLQRTFTDPTLMSWFDSISQGDFLEPAEVSGVPRPTKLLWGRQERILTPGQLEFWRTHLPAGTPIVEPEGMGHSPQLDSAARTAAEILSFARSLPELPP